MHEKQKSFKRPPRKHTPKGLEILYEDRDIVVVEKINGLLTVGTEKVKENTAHFLINEYVRKGNPKSNNRAYIVHRLDKDTSGILVFAKSEDIKDFLQKNWPDTRKSERTRTVITKSITATNPAISSNRQNWSRRAQRSPMPVLINSSLTTGRTSQQGRHCAPRS